MAFFAGHYSPDLRKEHLHGCGDNPAAADLPFDLKKRVVRFVLEEPHGS